MQEGEISFADGGEILDGIITRSRGEIKHMCSPKITSSSTTPGRDLKLQSPRFSEKAYSPRINELREGTPRRAMSGEVGPSNLGMKSPGTSTTILD